MHLSGTSWDPFRAQQFKQSETDLSSSEMEAKTGEVFKMNALFKQFLKAAHRGCTLCWLLEGKIQSAINIC